MSDFARVQEDNQKLTAENQELTAENARLRNSLGVAASAKTIAKAHAAAEGGLEGQDKK